MTAGRKPRLSVQTKVLVPVMAFLVLVPAIMVWIVSRTITRQVQEEARQALSTADGVFQQSLRNRSKDLLARVHNALNEPRYLATLGLAPQKSPVADNTIRQFLNDRLEDYGDDCEAILFITDEPSSPLVGARRGPQLRLDEFAQATRAISAQALGGDATVGLVSLNGVAYDVAAAPVILPGTGQLAGVLTVGVRIGETAVEELKKLTHTEILLMGNDQVIVSTLPAADAGWLRQVAGTGPRAGADIAQPPPLNGEHFLAWAGAYGGGDRQPAFHYLLLSSFEASLRALEDTQRMLVGVSIAGILVSAAAVWFFVRRITRPLSELRDSAEAVGRGDFSRRLERFSNDECGDLADAFNRMTASLRQSRAELEKAVETLKSTQEQLIQSEKLSAVGQFVAGVAHELNNPLTAMIGFADLLDMTSTDEKIRPHLSVIVKSAHRCHKIVHNLLSFARQHAPERGPTAINATIDEVLEIMAYDLRTSNVGVVRDFADPLPPILADAHQLQQVFVNIIGNARQAIEAFRPDGQITVRTRAAGSWVCIELADNGPGIPADHLSRIFDPFFTTKPVGKGTGLGLSLVYGTIQEHGGRIRVESQAGQGATFIIELPAAPEAADRRGAPPPAPAWRPRAERPSGKSVLVVDDEEWILSLTRELLAEDGHAVETAASGAAAEEALRRRKFDVVVCDWKMPGMNGIQFYEHLAATDPAMARRVLFMSGDIINDGFQAFLNRHGKACLPKPFPIGDFRAAVADLLTTVGTGGSPVRADN